MGDWIHCNSCFIKPGDNDNIPFQLTSCGHIYCNSCVQHGTRPRCQMCNAGNVSCILLSGKMGPDVKAYFVDPAEQLNKTLDESLKVMEFQRNHRRRYLSHIALMLNHQRMALDKAQEKYIRIQKLERSVAKKREENAFLRRALKEKQQRAAMLRGRFAGHRNSPSGFYMVTDDGGHVPRSKNPSRNISPGIIGPNYVSPKYGMRRTPPSLERPGNVGVMSSGRSRRSKSVSPQSRSSHIATPKSVPHYIPGMLTPHSNRGSPMEIESFESQFGMKQGRGATRTPPNKFSSNKSAPSSIGLYRQTSPVSYRRIPSNNTYRGSLSNSAERRRTPPYDIRAPRTQNFGGTRASSSDKRIMSTPPYLVNRVTGEGYQNFTPPSQRILETSPRSVPHPIPSSVW